MSGITFLVLSVIFSSGVAITMKVANANKLRLGQFLAVNYVVCLLALLAWGFWQKPVSNSIFIWALGIFVGVMYVLDEPSIGLHPKDHRLLNHIHITW